FVLLYLLRIHLDHDAGRITGTALADGKAETEAYTNTAPSRAAADAYAHAGTAGAGRSTINHFRCPVTRLVAYHAQVASRAAYRGGTGGPYFPASRISSDRTFRGGDRLTGMRGLDLHTCVRLWCRTGSQSQK